MKKNLHLYIGILFSLVNFNFSSEPSAVEKDKIVCSEFTDKYVDQVTGVKRFIAKDKINLRDYLGRSNFDLVWFKTKEEYTLAVKSAKKMCFQNDIAVSFHLLEGRVITCASAHIANCESLMTINFHDSKEGRKKLEWISNSEVVGISFENGGSEYKLKLKEKAASNFQQTLECLKTKK